MMFRFPSVICTRCTGFFCFAIIKGPPNDIYFIIEGPCDGYFTEKVSQARMEPEWIRAGTFLLSHKDSDNADTQQDFV